MKIPFLKTHRLRLSALPLLHHMGVLALPLLLLAGCYSELKVKPYAETGRQPYVMVCGEIKVTGNRRYLPATVSECATPCAGAYLAEFLHEQDYTGTKADEELLMTLMPGTMLGVPTGKDKVLVYARLRISCSGEEIATYRAACSKESYRNVYSGGVDNTAGRAECLEALKVNLEQQMLRDEPFWAARPGCPVRGAAQ